VSSRSEHSTVRDDLLARNLPLSVILIGRDRSLLRFREKAIRETSDLSVQILDPDSAEATARSAIPHLWIFCSRLDISRIVYLACSIRRYSPDSRLLLIKNSMKDGFEDFLFHWIGCAADGIDPLLSAVSTLAVAGR
jgi:hypothetical protein